MKRWTSDSKIPKDHVICPVCDQKYGFIDCRVTSHGKNLCLKCHIEAKKVSRGNSVIPTNPPQAVPSGKIL